MKKNTGLLSPSQKKDKDQLEVTSVVVDIVSKILTSIAALIVAVGGYIFVDNLDEISKRLDIFVKKVDLLAKNAEMTERAAKLIDSARPKIQIHANRPFTKRDKDTVSIGLSVCNFGDFEVRLKPKLLIIATEEIKDSEEYISGDKENLAKHISMDYLDSIYALSKGAETNGSWVIKLPKGTPSPLYYQFVYEVSHMPEIVTLIDNLAQKFGITKVPEISVESYSNRNQIPLTNYEDIGDKCNSRKKANTG